MRLVRFLVPADDTSAAGATPRVGAQRDDGVVDLAAAGVDASMTDLLAIASAAATDAEAAARWKDVVGAVAAAATVDQDVRLVAPVDPPNYLAIGLNYRAHVAEGGRPDPERPVVFNKQISSVIGPGEAIHVPAAAPDLVDYEGELAVVIGRRCRRVPKERAYEVIGGYTVANDVSVRDWQRASPTMTMGKSWDTHGPIGPWIVTRDEVGDPHRLALRTWVNGELRQESNTKELIFDCFALVEHLSTSFTLEPGDVVATGTSSGVGIAMKPPRLLQAGEQEQQSCRPRPFSPNHSVLPGRHLSRECPRLASPRLALASVEWTPGKSHPPALARSSK